MEHPLPTLDPDRVRAAQANLAEMARESYKLGLQSLFSGNLSHRIDDHWMFISRTMTSFRTVRPDDFILCPIQGDPSLETSSEARVHQVILDRYPHYRSVFHAHPPYTIRDSLNHFLKDLKPAYREARGALRYPVQIIHSNPIEHEGEDPIATAAAMYPEGPGMVVLRGHGVFAAAGNAEQALYKIQLLELSCRMNRAD